MYRVAQLRPARHHAAPHRPLLLLVRRRQARRWVRPTQQAPAPAHQTSTEQIARAHAPVRTAASVMTAQMERALAPALMGSGEQTARTPATAVDSLAMTRQARAVSAPRGATARTAHSSVTARTARFAMMAKAAQVHAPVRMDSTARTARTRAVARTARAVTTAPMERALAPARRTPMARTARNNATARTAQVAMMAQTAQAHARAPRGPSEQTAARPAQVEWATSARDMALVMMAQMARAVACARVATAAVIARPHLLATHRGIRWATS